MRRLFLILIKFGYATLFLVFSFPAAAEYGCQEGFVPVNQAGRNVCVADYNLPSWSRRSGHSGTSAPAFRWQTTWGAVAMDKIHGVIGVATGKESEEGATLSATQACQQDGGVSCVLVSAYHNQCVAIAWRPDTKVNNTMTALSHSKRRAEKLSMKACNGTSTTAGCRVVYSACTDAVQKR